MGDDLQPRDIGCFSTLSLSLSLSLSPLFLHFFLLLKFRTNSVLFRSCKLSLVSLSELIKPRRRLFVLYELSRFSFFFFYKCRENNKDQFRKVIDLSIFIFT